MVEKLQEICDSLARRVAAQSDILSRLAERNLVQPQPQPTGAGVPVWDLVIMDMIARDQAGQAKYGTPLRTNNGRDALIDAYQEALDLAVYLRQAIEERRTINAVCDQSEKT